MVIFSGLFLEKPSQNKSLGYQPKAKKIQHNSMLYQFPNIIENRNLQLHHIIFIIEV